MDQETKFRVVCIGDSITEGFGLGDDPSVYYPSLLQEFLGDDFVVFNEGVTSSCVTMMEDDEGRTFGLPYVLQPEYDEALSLAGDIYIIMLGTNDMKTVYNASPDAIANGLNEIVSKAESVMNIKQGFVPKILVVSPPEISTDILTGPFSGSFDQVSIDKSKRLAEYYKKVADKHGCMFLDAKQYIKPSVEDGLHLGPDGHKGLAEIIAKTILG